MKNQWKCNQCGYILTVEKPPNKCPSCQKNCTFIDVTCYIPECGGPKSGNIDPRLVQDQKTKK